MLDVWVHGRLEGCQDGCPKFLYDSQAGGPGGAAGAARQLEHWAARATLIGPDQTADDPLLPLKKRYVDDATGRIVWREDLEFPDYELTSAALATARGKALLAFQEGVFDAILLSDYDKGFLDDTLIHRLLDVADDLKGVPAVLDPKRPPTSDYLGAVLKCNLDYACRHFDALCDHDQLVITAGAFPPIIWGVGEDEPCPDPAPQPPCVNHVGAGDCFAAVLALALAHGLGLDEAAAWAHAAGKVYVRHAHGRPPWPFEVRKELDPAGGKVLLESDLAGLRKANPGRVVFTNGCFDLLGPQHQHLLREARKFGDVLVVGVNDDPGVSRLKGPRRPAVPLDARLAQLAACQDADWVVPFAGDTPEGLLEALKPAVWAKGDQPGLDWTGKEHAGACVTVPLLPGWSTSATLGRLRADSL